MSRTATGHHGKPCTFPHTRSPRRASSTAAGVGHGTGAFGDAAFFGARLRFFGFGAGGVASATAVASACAVCHAAVTSSAFSPFTFGSFPATSFGFDAHGASCPCGSSSSSPIPQKTIRTEPPPDAPPAATTTGHHGNVSYFAQSRSPSTASSTDDGVRPAAAAASADAAAAASASSASAAASAAAASAASRSAAAASAASRSAAASASAAARSAAASASAAALIAASSAAHASRVVVSRGAFASASAACHCLVAAFDLIFDRWPPTSSGFASQGDTIASQRWTSSRVGPRNVTRSCLSSPRH